MPSIKQIYRSPYMNALDVPKTGVLFTIKRSIVTSIRGRNGETVKKVVIYPEEPDMRALALNTTNASAVALVAGTEDYTEWKGTELRLVRKLVDSFGGKAWGVRVDVPEELLPDEEEVGHPLEETGEGIATEDDPEQE